MNAVLSTRSLALAESQTDRWKLAETVLLHYGHFLSPSLPAIQNARRVGEDPASDAGHA